MWASFGSSADQWAIRDGENIVGYACVNEENRAAHIALDNGKLPICSCEKVNLGSLKSIYKNRFVSTYELLSVEFN